MLDTNLYILTAVNFQLTMGQLGVLIVLLGLCVGAHTICPKSGLVSLPFIVDFAVWRGWQQAIIYPVNLEPSCRWAIVRLVKCLAINGVAAAIEVRSNIRVRSRVGIVVLSPPLRRNNTERLSKTVNELTNMELNTASYDWLLLARSERDLQLFNSVLNITAFRFDQNTIVIYPRNTEKHSELLGLCDTNFVYSNNKRGNNYNFNLRKHDRRNSCPEYNCIKNEFEINYYRTSLRFKNITRNAEYTTFGKVMPLLRSGITSLNNSRLFQTLNVSRFSLRQQFTNWSKSYGIRYFTGGIHVVQYFKVRTNSTLYASYLGVWIQGSSMLRLEVPYSVEERNFLGEELIVGRCNISDDGTTVMDDERPAAPVLLDDILDFINIRLNITSVTRYYGKLGFRTYEGVWTGLLGALMDSSVDVALEPVTALTSRYQDMDFIFPIAGTMCNIYIRHQETSAVRDIFLAPFSARLVACVVAVALIAAITVVLISRVATKLCNETRTISCTEALLWSVGILCQQGGPWTPPNPAASIVLIVCLLFAVVTYNAYAAFITSVLSVRVPSVETVADVLQSPNFKIGYIRNGADQMYLMSTKDVQLNEFYIRGYSEAENLVSSAEEGLARAARQDYAFFTGQLAARSTLRTLSQARGRCALRELPVPSTSAQLAFPLPTGSPYARPILISLLQLRSSGILGRLEAALVPSMPQCAPPSGFASARAADVRTALLLLLAGLLAALFIGVVEYCWKNRLQLRRTLVKCYIRFTSLF
ncbi:uncharacterized protein [Epargyreus clarus]|uniref:uncharacterized protein n=1 Tax=Epargyreus clarus TaxID=520877 RepID=UPI003C30D09F